MSEEGDGRYFRWLAAMALTVLLAAAIIIGGWQAGWWLKTFATNRAAHIYEQSYGAQSADFEQLQQALVDVNQIDVQIADRSTPPAEVDALRAQKAAVIAQACTVASHITSQLPPAQASFIASNC